MAPGYLRTPPHSVRLALIRRGAAGPGKEVTANGQEMHDAPYTHGAEAWAEDRAGQAPRTVQAQEGAVLGN